MEEVVVPALSSSSVFNSKQWQLQQHDLLLVQQRQQLEQLKKEQEELKSRLKLRRYGKAVNAQSSQQSTRNALVAQPAPHQPVATLKKPVSGNACSKLKQNETRLTDKSGESINNENHKEEIANVSDDTMSKDTENDTPAVNINTESTTITTTYSIETVEDTQRTIDQPMVSASYNDERPIRPLQG